MTTALTTRVSTDATYAPTVASGPLTSAQIDNNFISLATNKIETSVMDTAATANKLVLRDGSGNITVAGITASGITISGGSGVPVSSGGTGQISYTNGQLLIGNTTGNTLTKATLTGTSNQVTVTNGTGSITLSTPQDLASSSNVQFGSIGVGVSSTGTAGEIRATNSITAWYSDERLKENIQLIPNALDKVATLRGVTFEPNAIAESYGYKKQKEVGVLAGDLEKVLPEAVKPAPFDRIVLEGIEISRSGQEYKTVQYEKIVPLLIEAIKELHKEIKQLKGE
jgi:hypothetical protein